MQGITFKAVPQYVDRADYLAKIGLQAPVFDPAKPIRKWTDTGVVSEWFFNDDPAAPQITAQTFAAGELDTPNLTGTPSYPAYVVAPTKATWAGGIPLPPQYLCVQADAQIVATAIGGTLVNGTDYYKQFNITFVLDPTDPRQPWVVSGIAAPGFAGPNVVLMYGNGIGAPGSWIQDLASKQWGWVSTQVPDGNDGLQHPVQDIPCNPVPDGMQLVADTSSLIPTPVFVPIGTPAPGAAADSANIAQILSLVQQIAKAPVLGIG